MTELEADDEPSRSREENSERDGMVSVAAPEYDIATLKWINATTEAVMRAIDPLYASLGQELMPATPATTVQFDDGQDDLVVEPMTITVEHAVSIDALIAGDFRELHELIQVNAEQSVRQIITNMVSVLDTVTERTGNQVNATDGDLVDAFITALERTEVSFDDNGRPTSMMFGSPEMVEQLAEAEANMTAEQSRRLSDVMTRKRAEFYASRRRRRLPRHGH